jgi:hypothetical protein
MPRSIIIIFTILSILLAFFLLYSQSNDGQFELVKSESFAKSINNWQFPTAKPIIAIENKQITWQSAYETNQFNLPEDVFRVIFSKNSNYFGIVRSNRSLESGKNNQKLQIEIYSASREKLYELERIHYYDDSFPLIAISDLDGSVIIGQNTTSEIWFYNSNGSLVRKVQLFDDAEYDLERILQIDLSKNGTAAIVAGKRGASPTGSNAPNPSAEPHLLLFSKDGVELLRKSLPDFNSIATVISDNGQYIAVNSYTVALDGNITKRTIIFDNTGREIGEVNLLFKQARFSSDSKSLILADNNVATVYDLATENISWSYHISKEEGMIAAVDISNKGEIAALLVAKSEFKDKSFIFTDPQIKILDSNGKLLQELQMADQQFEKPALNLSDDAKIIFIGFKNAYQIYRAQ